MSEAGQGQRFVLTRLIRMQRKQRERKRAGATPSLSSLSSREAAAHSLLPCFAFREPPLALDSRDRAISVCVFPTGSSDFLVRVFSGEGTVSTLHLEWPQRTASHVLALCVSASPLAVYVTASDNYVYRVNLETLMCRNQLPHVVSSAAQRTLALPSLTQTAARVSDKLSADQVFEKIDISALIPATDEQPPPLCSACTRIGSVVVFGLGSGYVHIVDMDDPEKRARTVMCGSRDIVNVELLSTTVNTKDIGLLEVQLVVATCELGTIHVYPLSVCEGGVTWWIFHAVDQLSWFVPDCQSGEQIVQIVHDLGKAIEHSTALPDLQLGCESTAATVRIEELEGEYGGCSQSLFVGSAGWLLVVNRYSGKATLHDLQECISHWLRHDIDIQQFTASAPAAAANHASVDARNATQVSEHTWRVFAEVDLKSVLHLPATTDILSVTEYERALCVSCSSSDDGRTGSAELIVVGVSAQPGRGCCSWKIQDRILLSRTDSPLGAVKVGARWTCSAGRHESRDGVILFSSSSVLYLSKRVGDQQSRWLLEDPVKIAAAGKLDDAINVAVAQLQRSDSLPGRHDLLLHVAVWIIELLKSEEGGEMNALLHQVLVEVETEDFCALLPSLIGAGKLADVITVSIERRCVQELLSSITSQAVTTLSLPQTSQLIAAGYANEIALHSDGLLFKRLGTSAQLCVLLSSRRTFNHCHQRLLGMLPSLNLELLRCVIWVLVNWAAPSTTDQSALEVKSPTAITHLGILGYVKEEWDHKRSLADAFQAEQSDMSGSEPMDWTACELELGITCWLAFLMQRCCVVNDYRALIQGGLTMVSASARHVDTPQPDDVSGMMVRVLDDDASIEELQVVLMKLLVSVHMRCNTFLLLSRCIDLHNFPAAALLLMLSNRRAAALSMGLRVAHLMACFGSALEENEPSPMVNKRRNFWHRVDEIVDETESLANGRHSSVLHHERLSHELEGQLVQFMLGLVQGLVFHSFDSNNEPDEMLAKVLCMWSALKLPIAPLDAFLREAVAKNQSGSDICRLLQTAFFTASPSERTNLQADTIHNLPFTPEFYLEIAAAIVAKQTQQ